MADQQLGGEGGETIVPPVPTPEETNTPEHHEVMGHVLTEAIRQGKQEVPAMPDPLVCKPRELESWRVFKIMSEFVEGFEALKKYGLAASFFGTARATFEDHFYKEASELAGRLAKAGFAVITGGSAGVMEAANKGAYEAGGASVGLNIRLDQSQGLNTYLTDSFTFEHFFVRKVMLAFASEVYIFFPGGFGTMDEFFEIVTLVQTGKIRKVPIVIYGREYWEPLVAFMRTKFLEEHNAINAEDLDLFFLADTVDEAYEY
ncbi:MAG TPA: TIGR00730 family Rossman fold protein, partial [Candidatus Paceibacterota bacterium]